MRIDNSSILTFVLMFLFGTQLWSLFWGTGKSLLSLVVFFLVLRQVNPKLSKSIMNLVISIVRFDFGSLKNGLVGCYNTITNKKESKKKNTKKVNLELTDSEKKYIQQKMK
tara:strand:- start:691 stop:1023 length:333 start_codon:yes stop_codon:yes gene_type:complete